MEGHGLGEASRLAAATGAYVCFEDEAGQNLRPPKARTWAPRGHTPVVRVSGKGSGRVSVAGLACYKPGARARWFYRVRVHRGLKGERRSTSEADYASLITAAHNQLHAPVILVWDNLNTHISAAMRRFIEAHPDWLTQARLPAYAPDLDAVEGAWANMKNGLGNLAATDVDQLTAIMKNRLKSIQYRPALIDPSSPRPGSPWNPSRRSTMSAMVHRESPHLAWRCVLLSGPAGSGKTTVCRLGYRAMMAAWGHPAAAIDTDQLYLNVDARWELPYDDTRNAMVLAQATQLALSLFEHGWQTVIICGNSLFEATDTAPIVTRLTPIAEVHHVTLTPALPTVLARCAGTPSRNPSQLAADVELLARKPHPGSAHLDNSNMTPEQTLTELARLADTGVGRLNCPP